MKNYDRTLGVLGGMGPEATVYFMNLIVKVTDAEEDQDHIPVIAYSYPQVPDRTLAYLGKGESPLAALVNGVTKLQHAGADTIAIPCNSAHLWYDEIVKSSGAHVLNMVNLAVQTVKAGSRVGILATTLTVLSKLYETPLREKGVDILLPDDQQKVMDQIRLIKRGDISTARKILLQEAKKLTDLGATHILAGCTEVPLAIGSNDLSVPFIDPMEVLASESVRQIGGKLKRRGSE